MMKGPSGNVLPESYEKSIEGQMLLTIDELDKAVWKLTHAQAVRRTKKEMEKDIREAEELILRARKRLRG